MTNNEKAEIIVKEFKDIIFPGSAPYSRAIDALTKIQAIENARAGMRDLWEAKNRGVIE